MAFEHVYVMGKLFKSTKPLVMSTESINLMEATKEKLTTYIRQNMDTSSYRMPHDFWSAHE
jgi:hypothetical protein